MKMNAQLPPKPKIDIRQYLNRSDSVDGPKQTIKRKPPPLPERPLEELTISRSSSDSTRPDSSSNSNSTAPVSITSNKWKPAATPSSVPTPNISPLRNYAPKPTHISVPLKTHQADNKPPAQVPMSFLSSKSKSLLAANDRYICISTTSKTLLYSWRSSSLIWELKMVALTAAFLDEAETIWLGTSIGRILIIDVNTGQIKQVLERGHVKPVTFIAAYKQGLISLSADDGRLNVWSPYNNGSPFKVTRVRSSICGTSCRAASGGYSSHFLWLCRNRDVDVYQPIKQTLPLLSVSLPGRGTNLGSITSTAAVGDLAFFGQNDGFISVFKKTKLLGVINGGIYTVTALAVSSCTELWVGTRSGEILVFTLHTTQISDEESIQLSASLLRQWKPHNTSITQIIFAESKSAVLTVDKLGTIMAWNWTPSDIMPVLPSINQGFNVQIMTWNIGACSPFSVRMEDLLTQRTKEADIVVLGLQEVVELENTSQHALNIVRPTDVEMEKEHQNWQKSFETLLRPLGFTLVVTKSMVGIMTCLFIRHERARYMSNIEVDVVKTGIGGAYGNKGGVVISFSMANMVWRFVNCHLAAGQTSIIQRNRDASQILNFERLQSDVCFFFGDTNYRINAAREQAEQIIKKKDWIQLRKHDQLLTQVTKIPSFCLGKFQEGYLSFPPTYKYDPGTNFYDTSEKKRVPSWCDRILFRGKSIMVNEYNALASVNNSDHKPVIGSYTVPLLV